MQLVDCGDHCCGVFYREASVGEVIDGWMDT